MDKISKSLLKFLNNDELRVATLKGEWGVGKTFFWKNFFNSIKEKLDFRAYSYVSLFGANEIADLERQVFANFEVIDEKKMSKYLEKVKPISAILEAVEIPYLNSSKAINELIQNKLVDNFLVCIDDLERKEDSISGSSVLGFISQLKEEKSCKIVLVYNDQRLDEETEKQINEYREKVVDLELTYCPTIGENLSIIWPEKCPDCVANIFNALKLNNIRVMQRVKWAIDYFAEEISGKYPELHPSFESKCAKLTVVYHAYSDEVSFENLLSTNPYSSFFFKNEDKNEEFGIVKKLNYFREDFDVVVAEYLVNGFVDFSVWEDLLSTKNEQYRLTDINNRQLEIWQKFHSNFVVPQEEFIKLQTEFLEKHIKDLYIREVVSAVKFIQKLDPNVDLTQLLSEAIDHFVSKLDRLETPQRLMLKDEPEIMAMIEERLTARKPDYSISDLFVALAGSNSCNPDDIRHFLRYTEDDFYHWITTEESVDVIDLLSNFLSRFGSHNNEEKKVTDRIRVALERVKERSVIDRCRVEYFIEGTKG